MAAEAKDKVDVLIQDDCHITMNELCAAAGTGQPAVMAIIRKLSCRKVCARWVLKILTIKHRTAPYPCPRSVQNFSSTM
jgi:hypothetical protein